MEGRRGSLTDGVERWLMLCVVMLVVVEVVVLCGPQRLERLANGLVLRARVSKGLDGTSHGLRITVLHDPQGASVGDLLLEVLNGTFESLQTRVSGCEREIKNDLLTLMMLSLPGDDLLLASTLSFMVLKSPDNSRRSSIIFCTSASACSRLLLAEASSSLRLPMVCT